MAKCLAHKALQGFTSQIAVFRQLGDSTDPTIAHTTTYRDYYEWLGRSTELPFLQVPMAIYATAPSDEMYGMLGPGLEQVMAEGNGNFRGVFSPLLILTSMDLARCMSLLSLEVTKYSIAIR
jgi:hypothetical protein